MTVSKIFPAGVGWQGASVVADSMGYTATELPFFLMTGAGDFLGFTLPGGLLLLDWFPSGVFAGHVSFYAVKKMAIDKTIDMSETVSCLLEHVCPAVLMLASRRFNQAHGLPQRLSALGLHGSH